MGNCFSDPSPKGGQRLGSGPPSDSSNPSNPSGAGPAGKSVTASSRVSAGKPSAPPRTLGDPAAAGAVGEDGLDPRERASKAAEERAKRVRLYSSGSHVGILNEDWQHSKRPSAQDVWEADGPGKG